MWPCGVCFLRNSVNVKSQKEGRQYQGGSGSGVRAILDSVYIILRIRLQSGEGVVWLLGVPNGHSVTMGNRYVSAMSGFLERISR